MRLYEITENNETYQNLLEINTNPIPRYNNILMAFEMIYPSSDAFLKMALISQISELHNQFQKLSEETWLDSDDPEIDDLNQSLKAMMVHMEYMRKELKK